MALQTSQWNVILDQWDGLYTARDSDDIGQTYSPNVLNVRIAGSHFRGSAGYEIVGTRIETAGEVTSQYTFNKNDGTKRMVRVRDGATGTLEWYDATNDEWYTLLASLTAGARMAFAEFNTSAADQMIFCNGVQNLSVWSGAATRLTAALAGGETSIPVDDTTQFPASGTIIYNGIEIAYSAKTSTTFTVVSAHASAGSDDGVAQAADDSTYSSLTKGNILLSAKDRLWIARDDSNELDYSDEGAALTFTAGATRTDSGSEDVLNIGGRITGLAEKGDEIIILGPDGAVGFSFSYPTSTTKAPLYREIFNAPDRGCVSPKSVFKVNNEVYFASRNSIEAIGDLEGGEKLFNSTITRRIAPTTKQYDFTEAATVYFQKENIILVACKTDSDLSFNDVVIGIESYEGNDGSNRIGFTRFDWPVNDWAILDDLYFGSSAEQNSFKAFSTYQNDGSPRNIRYATPRLNLKDPFQHKECPKIAVRGFIKDGTDIDVDILYNGGFAGELSKTIESTGDYVSNVTLNTLGAFALGTNPIGATLEEVSELKEFLVYLDVTVDYRFSDIELIFSSDTDGGTFMVTHAGFAMETAGFATLDNITI